MVTHRKGSCSGAVGAGQTGGAVCIGQGWKTAAIHRVVKVEDGQRAQGRTRLPMASTGTAWPMQAGMHRPDHKNFPVEASGLM